MPAAIKPTLAFICPACAAPIGQTLVCEGCGRAYALRDGIYRFLLPERQVALTAFLDQYRRVREQDGYRSRPGSYYRALPSAAPDDPQAQTWRVRAATFRALLRRAGLCPAAGGAGLAVLDLGAGNGWLSHRLSALGHSCVAVDVLDDAEDGLGTARHYATDFPRVQADFAQLPLAPGQFDRVIYNGALHYALDIEDSLRHGLSRLRPGGALAILDSPTFRSKRSALQMLAGQAQRHQHLTGTLETPVFGQGYLLASELMAIGERLGLSLRYWPTWVGLLWSLRRRWAGFRLRREPASFGLWLGVKQF